MAMATCMTITGGCLCGAVRYEALAEPIITRMCWCRVCQYLACGNAAVNTFFASAEFRLNGALTDFRSVADSGNVMHRGFCPTCGTHVTTSAEARPHLIGVRSGTLDEPERVKPVAIIWAARAPAWAQLDAALPRFDGQPPPVG
ncbi:MAG: GFA family protein [Myxococcota bacterium]